MSQAFLCHICVWLQDLYSYPFRPKKPPDTDIWTPIVSVSAVLPCRERAYSQRTENSTHFLVYWSLTYAHSHPLSRLPASMPLGTDWERGAYPGLRGLNGVESRTHGREEDPQTLHCREAGLRCHSESGIFVSRHSDWVLEGKKESTYEHTRGAKEKCVSLALHSRFQSLFGARSIHISCQNRKESSLEKGVPPPLSVTTAIFSRKCLKSVWFMSSRD